MLAAADRMLVMLGSGGESQPDGPDHPMGGAPIPDHDMHRHYTRVDEQVARAVQFWVMHTYAPLAMQAIEEYNMETVQWNSSSHHALTTDNLPPVIYDLAARSRTACDRFNLMIQTHICDGKGHDLPYTSVVLENALFLRCVPRDTLWRALDKVFSRNCKMHAEQARGAPKHQRTGISRRPIPHRDFPLHRTAGEEEELEWTIVKGKTVNCRDGSMVWAGEQSDYSPTYVLASYGISGWHTNHGPVHAGACDYGTWTRVATATWLEFMVIWDRRVKELFLRLIPAGENLEIRGFMNALHGISGLLGRHERQLFRYQVEIQRWDLHEFLIYDQDWAVEDARGRSFQKICWQGWDILVEAMDKDAKRDPTIDIDDVYIRFTTLSPNDRDKPDSEAVKRMARWTLGNGDLFWVQGHKGPKSTMFSIARTLPNGMVEVQPSLRGATLAGPALQFDNGHQMVYQCRACPT